MDEAKVIYQHNKPHGIRNKNGYLLFFPRISKYSGQEERYRNELDEQFKLADSLCDWLNQEESNE